MTPWKLLIHLSYARPIQSGSIQLYKNYLAGKENNIYWKNGDTSIQTSIRLEGTVNNEPNLGFPIERNLASKTPDSRGILY